MNDLKLTKDLSGKWAKMFEEHRPVLETILEVLEAYHISKENGGLPLLFLAGMCEGLAGKPLMDDIASKAFRLGWQFGRQGD